MEQAKENKAMVARRVADRLIEDVESARGAFSTDWGQALSIHGLVELGKALDDSNYIEVGRDWLDGHIDAGVRYVDDYKEAFKIKQGIPLSHFCGSWGVLLATHSLYELFGNKRYVDLATTVGEFITYKAMRLLGGGLSHTETIRWLFVDTIYYAVPPLVNAAAITSRKDFASEAQRQLSIHHAHLIDPDSRLYRQCYEPGTGNVSHGFWARGVGWMTMSLASIVGMVEENFRQEVEEMIRFVFPAVLSQQTDTGMWRNVMTHPYSYLESSATAMFIYSFSIAIKAKAIDGDLFQKSIDRAWTALSEYVGEDGVFSGVAGPVWLRWQDGGYDNIEREAFYWGTGSFLLAAAEVIGGARA